MLQCLRSHCYSTHTTPVHSIRRRPNNASTSRRSNRDSKPLYPSLPTLHPSNQKWPPPWRCVAEINAVPHTKNVKNTVMSSEVNRPISDSALLAVLRFDVLYFELHVHLVSTWLTPSPTHPHRSKRVVLVLATLISFTHMSAACQPQRYWSNRNNKMTNANPSMRT